ncbi:hypothetical protein EDC32_102401 [Laceyella sacchari]|nr:hypothetical protein EDC32_102401 [Laceyella sacchari]
MRVAQTLRQVKVVINMSSFQPFQKSFTSDSGKNVKKIDLRLVVSDVTGRIQITDVMLQGGSIATVWTGHASEIQWSFDG